MQPSNVNEFYKHRLTRALLTRFVTLVLVYLLLDDRVEYSMLPQWPVLVLLSTCALNGLTWSILRIGWADKHLTGFGHVQIVIDVAVASLVIYLTGGIHSWFTVLLFLPVITAGYLVSGAFAIFYAALGGLVLALNATVYQIAFQDFSAPEFSFVVELPRKMADLPWPDDGAHEATMLKLNRIQTFTNGRSTRMSSDRSDLLKKAIDGVLAEALRPPPLHGGGNDGPDAEGDQPPKQDRTAESKKVSVLETELERRGPTGVDVRPWLLDLSPHLPLTWLEIAWTMGRQFIAMMIVAFLVYGYALRSREELLVNMFHRSRDGYLVFDRRNRVLFCNDEAREMLRIPPSAALQGIRVDRMAAGDGRDKLLSDIREMLAGQRSTTLFWPVGPSDEPRRPGDPQYDRLSRLRVTEIHSVQVESKHSVEATVISFHDVTERVRAEEAERRLDRLDATGSMAAGLAHEVRNPLAAIRAAAQQLKSDQDEADRANSVEEASSRLFGLLIRECDRLDAIVGSFLKFAKQSRPVFRRVDLRDLFAETLDLLPVSSHAGEVRVEVKVEPGVVVRGDADQLKQVLLNLGLNALDAISGNGGQLTFSGHRSHAKLDKIQIIVSDSGCGMSERELERIGTPFFTTKHDGTGLGIAIAMKIVKEHGGDIEFRGSPESGTVVSFDLEDAAASDTATSSVVAEFLMGRGRESDPGDEHSPLLGSADG